MPDYVFNIKWPSNEFPFEQEYKTQKRDNDEAEEFANTLRDLGYIVTRKTEK